LSQIADASATENVSARSLYRILVSIPTDSATVFLFTYALVIDWNESVGDSSGERDLFLFVVVLFIVVVEVVLFVIVIVIVVQLYASELMQVTYLGEIDVPLVEFGLSESGIVVL
jgi:hypothetical protein